VSEDVPILCPGRRSLGYVFNEKDRAVFSVVAFERFLQKVALLFSVEPVNKIVGSSSLPNTVGVEERVP
jgi:hypothetical protein